MKEGLNTFQRPADGSVASAALSMQLECVPKHCGRDSAIPPSTLLDHNVIERVSIGSATNLGETINAT